MVTVSPFRIPLYSRDSRSGPSTSTDTGAAHQWLFEYQSPGRLYVVTWSFTDGDFDDPSIRVFKSTDGGVTWVVQDNANSPLIRFNVFDVVQNGNSLHCAYADFTTHFLKVKTFNVTTDTWGTVSADGPLMAQPPNDTFALKMARRNSGDVWCFFNYQRTDFFSTGEGSQYVVLSGGVWGAIQTFTLDNLTNRKPFTKLIYDSGTDLIHVISLVLSLPTPTWTIIHNSVTSGGVISSLDTVGVVGTPVPSGNPVPYVGKCTIWNGFICVPTTFFRSGISIPAATQKQTRVYMGTPVAAPVWTPHDVNTLAVTTQEQDFESYSFPSNNGLTLFVFFVYLQSLNSLTSPDQLYYVSTQDGATWTDPVLHYDAVANPQADVSPSGNYIHTICAIQLANGSFGAVASLQTEDAVSSSECIGYYLLDQVPGTPPTLICNSPPGGFVGVAYSHQLGLSGGTPPYTLTISVGSLPPGLSASNTGLITGAPTLAGTYPFTVHVVDSTGAIANVYCSIPIVDLPASNCPDADQGGPG